MQYFSGQPYGSVGLKIDSTLGQPRTHHEDHITTNTTRAA